jgi:ubiquinone/menaquinone biosynthesis C-methylase UbiE
MSISDNFGNPQGFVGRLMLSGMNMGHTPMAKWGFAQFEVPRAAIVADIGCGGGYNVKRLLERCSEGHVFGVDISEESVRKSIAVNKTEVGKRCDIVQASVESLPFDDHVLDLATAFETVYFWPDIAENFKEVKRVLADDGHFVVINDPGDPNKHWEDMIPGMTSYTAEQIAEAMKGAGFSDIRISREKNMFCVDGTAS